MSPMSPMSPTELSTLLLVIFASVAVLMIVVALPVVLSMRQAAKDRELLHAERLKALEMGRPLPGEATTQSSAGATGVGVWVPICAFGIALAATQHSENSQAADFAAWISAGCVGVTGVICGTILTLHNAMKDGQSAPAKPQFEEHEIDTVSSRGF